MYDFAGFKALTVAASGQRSGACYRQGGGSGGTDKISSVDHLAPNLADTKIQNYIENSEFYGR
jgi:hypothetical protein